MFRKKDAEPAMPSGSADPAAGPVRVVGGEGRPASPAPDFPRRQADIGASPGIAPTPLSPLPERGPGVPDRGGAYGLAGAGAEPGKRLTVGPGISLSGEITACDRLVVQGSVQVTLNDTRAIEIAESGRFTNGKAEVEEAEISGTYEGELTVRNRLLIRSTGRVQGTVRYGELEIERGGKLSGQVSMLESPET